MALNQVDLPPQLDRLGIPSEGLCLLPERIEDGKGIYRSELADLLPFMRSKGIEQGTFLHQHDERLWRELKGHTELAFALSIASSLISSAMWDGMKAAFGEWVRSLGGGARLEIDLVIPNANDRPAAVHISGDSEDVTKALDRLPDVIREVGLATKGKK